MLLAGAAPAQAQEESSRSEGVAASAIAPTEVDEAEAQALFAAGRSAYEDGRYEDALDHFRDSYEQSGRPTLLYNIGMSADRLRRDEEALEAFEEFLARVPEHPNRVSTENRVAALRRVLEERDVAEAAAAPTPAEVAAAAQPAPAEPVASSRDVVEDDGGSVLSTWWFWTIIGVLVVGGAAAGVAVAMSGDTQQEPIPGDNGVVVMTLGSR